MKQSALFKNIKPLDKNVKHIGNPNECAKI